MIKIGSTLQKSDIVIPIKILSNLFILESHLEFYPKETAERKKEI